MDYLPAAAIIYGLFLMALSFRFSQYTIGEFSTLVYGIFFLAFGFGFSLLKIGVDLGLKVETENTWIWVFSVAFLATAVHTLFKTAVIFKVSHQEVEKI